HRDILFVEGCKDYVKVVTTTKTYLHHATMKEMVDTLAPGPNPRRGCAGAETAETNAFAVAHSLLGHYPAR
nr:hypothetical protein [Tanacetum cinerariifolium]